MTCLFTVVMGLTNSYLLLDQAPGQDSNAKLVGLGPDVPPKTSFPHASANLNLGLPFNLGVLILGQFYVTDPG